MREHIECIFILFVYRSLHQHALLNLAALHLDEGGYLEARAVSTYKHVLCRRPKNALQALAQAVRTARHMNDKECLAACVR